MLEQENVFSKFKILESSGTSYLQQQSSLIWVTTVMNIMVIFPLAYMGLSNLQKDIWCCCFISQNVFICYISVNLVWFCSLLSSKGSLFCQINVGSIFQNRQCILWSVYLISVILLGAAKQIREPFPLSFILLWLYGHG